MKLNDKNIKLGIAPIGWTNDDLPELGKENTFEQCISEMALAGFQGCEVGNKFPKDIGELKKKLEIRKLKIVNAWYSTFFTTNKKEETIKGFIKHRDFLYSMGAKVIGVSEQGFSIQGMKNKNIFKDKHIFTETQWSNLIEGLEELGKLAKEKDMILAFHHHMGTGVQTEEEINRLMESTSENVTLLIDVGHLFFATESQEAVERISKKYIDRTTHIHLKDVRKNTFEESKSKGSSFLESVFNGIFTVPGDGYIDFEPFFKIVEKSDYKGWMVVEAEQNPSIANPFEYAVKARRFIKEKTNL